MGKFRQVVALLMLSVLMVSTLASLHTYSHSDSDLADVENCSWCQLAVNVQQASFVDAEIQSAAAAPNFPPVRLQSYSRTPELNSSSYLHYLFSRPPPALI